MSDIVERMAAYIKHDHNVAWKTLWDRCEQAEDEVKRLTIQVERMTTERDAALLDRDRWFATHTAHQQACQSLASANGELLKRCMEARRDADANFATARAALEENARLTPVTSDKR